MREIPVLFVVAPGLDSTRPSLGAMNAFFSLGVLDEARRRMPFVQQIAPSVRGPVTKVQTMPAEPLLRPEGVTASACTGADRRRGLGGRLAGSAA